MAENDTGSRERGSRGVQWRNNAVGTLADVDDDDPSVNSLLDDLGQAAVDATWRVAHTECLKNQAAQIWHPKHRIQHLRLDSGEDAQTGHMRCVEIPGDLELGNLGRPLHEGPVDIDT